MFITYYNYIKDHIRHVKDILKALEYAAVTLKLNKCKLFIESVEYMGHIIRPGRLHIDFTHTRAILQAAQPSKKLNVINYGSMKRL